MNRSPLTIIVLTLTLLALPAMGCTGVPIDPASKLDDGLGEHESFVAVFIRMDDQLFRRGGDYERFCQTQPATVDRLELREQVVHTLQTKADGSYDAVAQAVERLIADGQVRGLQRYWIVNGFACEATGEGVRALAALRPVDFVYRQRNAAQHRTGDASLVEADDDRDALYRRLLAALEDPDETPFDAAGLEVSWNLRRIGADRAWTQHGVTGQGVVVAVLDSGMMAIPALTPALWHNPDETLNGQDDDGNGYIDDVFGYDFQHNRPYTVGERRPPHGTLCAGIIAGRPSGGERNIITGVAPRARVMPLCGFGQLRAYEYALENGADVLSMSYTFDSRHMGHYRGLFRTAHEHLSAAGVVSVGGAGNYARSRPAGWQIGIPKDIPCVIAAAGILEDGQAAAASSTGPVSWAGVRYYDDPALDAPLSKPDVTGCFGGYPMWTRVDVWQGARRDRLEVVQEDAAGYVLATGPRGNSFSGPHAAGVAALMLEANPHLPAWRIKELMEATCTDWGEPGRDTTFGAGLLQADKAVAAAQALR